MLRRYRTMALVGVLGIVGLANLECVALEWSNWLPRCHAVPAPRSPDSPPHYVTSPPGSEFYPQFSSTCYPPYGRLSAVPAYNYGYFGARSKPVCVTHRGYFGDLMQWTTPRGF